MNRVLHPEMFEESKTETPFVALDCEISSGANQFGLFTSSTFVIELIVPIPKSATFAIKSPFSFFLMNYFFNFLII